MTSINFPDMTPPTPPYDIDYEDVVIRSAADAPYTITRKRFTKGRMKPVVFSWGLIPHSEYLTLMDFYNTTIAGGSLSFNFTIPIRQNAAIVKEMLLQSPPKTKYVGSGFWEVSLTMEEVL